jgi:hypothetical protein
MQNILGTFPAELSTMYPYLKKVTAALPTSSHHPIGGKDNRMLGRMTGSAGMLCR